MGRKETNCPHEKGKQVYLYTKMVKWPINLSGRGSKGRQKKGKRKGKKKGKKQETHIEFFLGKLNYNGLIGPKKNIY